MTTHPGNPNDSTDQGTLYLQIHCPVALGMNHHLSNFEQHCRLARYLDAVLVSPQMTFYGRPPQTRDYPTKISEFIDCSQVMCYGQPAAIVEHAPENTPRVEMPVNARVSLEQIEITAAEIRERGAGQLILNIWKYNNLLRVIPAFQTASERLDERFAHDPQAKSFFFPVGGEARRIAALIAERIGRPYTCMHIRRSAAHHEVDRFQRHTSLDSIAQWFEAAGLPGGYIMSDEDPEYFQPLRDRGLQLFLHVDFPELRALTNHDAYGGHMLYPVERQLMHLAKRRVLTRPKGFETLCYADCFSPHPIYDYTLMPPHGPHRPQAAAAAAKPPNE